MAPKVTALRARRGGRVLVQIDGHDWRELPEDVIVRASLTPGTELDRPRLREVARERRRAQALAAAGRTLSARDLPARALDVRLERRGIRAADRARALSTLQGAGLVDDGRFARNRALALAGRCLGDAAIRFDLEEYGVEPELVEEAVGGLEPETARAERIVASRGRSPATARFLARKGFGEAAVESAAGEVLG
jgi:SOS response regulatory protein OraA/RecX